jgi:hypothetical protein
MGTLVCRATHSPGPRAKEGCGGAEEDGHDRREGDALSWGSGLCSVVCVYLWPTTGRVQRNHFRSKRIRPESILEVSDFDPRTSRPMSASVPAS